MSHTTTVDDVVFTDLEALKAAVNDLAARGIRCSLQKGGTPRAFYQNQEGLGPADFVLKLEDSSFDVGFYKDDAKRGYVARTDTWGGHIHKVLGGSVAASTNPRTHMGLLYQTYATQAVIRKAVQKGHTVQRIPQTDGSIRLVLNVR